MTIFQIKLNLSSTLETENTKKTTSNTIFIISTLKRASSVLKKALKNELLEKDS